MTRYVFILICGLVFTNGNAQSRWYRTIYQKIQQDPELNGFNILVRNNSVIKRNLDLEEVAVFAPDNEAFHNYKSELYSELASYHMTFKPVLLEDLYSSINMLLTVDENNPPLWITKRNGDVFINNARIIPSKSNNIFWTRGSNDGKKQILHTLDTVLDPKIRFSDFSPNAYDFLSSPNKWEIHGGVSSFFSKVQEYNLQYIFKQKAGHTFFIPLDSGIDNYKFSKMSKQIVLGHTVPYYVLFSRPTPKDFAHESLANDDYLYIVLSFVEKDRKLFVKGVARGALGSRNSVAEFYSEIVVANIPVKNGVVHLIAEPLGIFNRPLKPFPYLPVLSKLSGDPNLSTFYSMGERTEFNKIFENDLIFTYFIPTDNSWTKAKNMELEPVEDDLKILKRHLIAAKTPYSVEQLESLTKANNNTYLELPNEENILRIMVLKINGDYYIKWYNKYIKIIRPNYECSNGIVHILAGPMVNFRRKDVHEENDHTVENNMQASYWRVVKNIWERIV